MRTEVKLENGTILKVGKTYTQFGWTKEERITVTAVGNLFFLANDSLGYEDDYSIEDNWLHYEEEETEKWFEHLRLDFESSEETRYRIEYSNRPKLANVILLREWDSKEKMINDLKK